jgi:replicative DNA helicase
VFQLVLNYYEKFKSIPTLVALKECVKSDLNVSKHAEFTMFVESLYAIKIEEQEYIKNAVKEFIKRNLYVRSLLEAQNLYNTGQVQEAYDLTLNKMREVANLSFSPPDRSFFFDSLLDREETRRARLLSDTPDKFTTGIGDLDEVMSGGLSRGELGIVFGGPKSGKSISLIHMGISVVRSLSANVLHVVLEGSREQTETRYDSRLAMHRYTDLKGASTPVEVIQKMEREYKRLKNSLVVRAMTDRWDYTVLDIEAEIQELKAYGFIPDVLIVDYGDLMAPRTTTLVGETYLSQQEVFRDLKTLASRYRMAVWTATQTKRLKENEDPTFVLRASDMADSYAKARICDLSMSLNQTTDERKMGSMRLYVDLYRDNDCKKVIQLRQDFARMIFHSQAPSFIKV